MGGRPFCSNSMEKIENVANLSRSFLIIFGLLMTLITYLGLLMLRRTTKYTRTRVKQRRRLGSGYWTRRRVYWRRREISRTAYIAEALQSSIKQRINSQSELQKRKEEMLTKPCSDIMKRNGHAVNGAQLEGEVLDGNELMLSHKKTRCSSSKRGHQTNGTSVSSPRNSSLGH